VPSSAGSAPSGQPAARAVSPAPPPGPPEPAPPTSSGRITAASGPVGETGYPASTRNAAGSGTSTTSGNPMNSSMPKPPPAGSAGQDCAFGRFRSGPMALFVILATAHAGYCTTVRIGEGDEMSADQNTTPVAPTPPRPRVSPEEDAGEESSAVRYWASLRSRVDRY
jgi:hypothetical protein